MSLQISRMHQNILSWLWWLNFHEKTLCSHKINQIQSYSHRNVILICIWICLPGGTEKVTDASPARSWISPATYHAICVNVICVYEPGAQTTDLEN